MGNETQAACTSTEASVKDPHLTIGEFARRSMLSPKALRLYERQGLLVPAEVDPANRYRRYHESQLVDARLIARLRRLDMPLAIVAELMAAPSDRRSDALVAELMAAPSDRRSDALVGWWDAMERRMAGKRELLVHLLITLAGKERNFDMYEIEERDVPEQVVLTEQRHTTVQGLNNWLDDCMPRLHGLAADTGGIAGPAFVICHGEVNDESDGPVEVCVPIPPDLQGSPGAPTRVEPAHREAYTRIRKSQVEFPQILDAYEAVEQWIAKSNRQMSASPREVYFADFMNAGPDDEVVDIAFPIA